MVWNLLLAHLLGDFVLQTDWMVRMRDRFWVLSIHASIHLALMLLLVGRYRKDIWPYLLIIAIVHLSQDYIKIHHVRNIPLNWVGVVFIIDQGFHFVTILAAIWWFQKFTNPIITIVKPVWVIVSITYLFGTYIWFITERVFNQSNTDYLQNIEITKFPRMLSRAVMASLFLLLWTRFAPALASLAVVFTNPYPRSKFRRRALLTDVSVSLLAMIFLFLVLG